MLEKYDPRTKSSRPGPKEYRAAMNGNSWKIQLCVAIDHCMTRCKSKDEFLHEMKKLGYDVVGTPERKYITYILSGEDGTEKRVRDIKLHEEKYRKENMENEFRIRAELYGQAQGEEYSAHTRRGRVDGGNPNGANQRRGLYIPGKRNKNVINPFGMTVGTFAAEHYLGSVEGHLSPNTLTFYRSVIEDIIVPSFGKIRLTDITAKHRQALIDYLTTPGARADKNNDKPLSASTVKRYATVFSSLMTEAHRMGLVEENRLRNGAVRYPKIKKEPIKAYDRDEAAVFMEGLTDEPSRTRALLITSLLMGLRRGEVVVLKWEDIDFKNCTLSVNKSAYKEKGKPQALKAPKSQNSVRTVYFSQIYAQALTEWQTEQTEQRKTAGARWHEQGFVFTNEVGDMISLYAPTGLCSEYEERRGLRHLKFHGLRHTCGSLLVENGADLEMVKAVFGHESIRTTEQYLTPYDASKRRAAEVIADIVTNREREVVG